MGKGVMPLTRSDLNAIAMRFNGAEYGEIARSIGRPECTLRVQFSKNGRLHKPYQEYVDAQREEVKRQNMPFIINKYRRALEVVAVIQEFADRDSTRLKAAQTIIELIAPELGKQTTNNILNSVNVQNSNTITPAGILSVLASAIKVEQLAKVGTAEGGANVPPAEVSQPDAISEPATSE
mgnify:CR=1 FL=1